MLSSDPGSRPCDRTIGACLMSVVQRRKFSPLRGASIALALGLCLMAEPSSHFRGARAYAAWPAQHDSLLILHTNDIHAHLLPFQDAKGATVGGAAARSALIASMRAHHGRTLLLDAGDVFQGTPIYNFFRGV